MTQHIAIFICGCVGAALAVEILGTPRVREGAVGRGLGVPGERGGYRNEAS